MKLFIAMGPVASLHHIKSPIKYMSDVSDKVNKSSVFFVVVYTACIECNTGFVRFVSIINLFEQKGNQLIYTHTQKMDDYII